MASGWWYLHCSALTPHLQGEYTEYSDGLQPEPEDEVEVAGEEEQQQGQQGEV